MKIATDASRSLPRERIEKKCLGISTCPGRYPGWQATPPDLPMRLHSGLKRRICRQRRRLFTVAGAAHVGWRGQLHVSRLTARLDRRAGTKTGRLYFSWPAIGE